MSHHFSSWAFWWLARPLLAGSSQLDKPHGTTCILPGAHSAARSNVGHSWPIWRFSSRCSRLGRDAQDAGATT